MHCKTYNIIFERQKVYIYSVFITLQRSNSNIYMNIGLKYLILMGGKLDFYSDDFTANILMV